MNILYIIVSAIAAIIIATISSFWIVSSWEVWIKYHYGSIQEVINEWTYFINPITEDVEIVDIKTQKLEIETSAASKDLQTVTTSIALNYAVDNKLVMNLYREIWSDYVARVINPTMQEAIKSATSKYTAEQLVTKREAVKDWIKSRIMTKLNPLWIKVQELNITNFKFSAEFDNAVNQKVKAEQDALAQKNVLEKVKYEAQQSIEKAKAEAESIKIQAQSVSAEWGADYVKLKWIEKWNWSLPTTTLGNESNILFNAK